jgi:hypothetical protein
VKSGGYFNDPSMLTPWAARAEELQKNSPMRNRKTRKIALRSFAIGMLTDAGEKKLKGVATG